MVVYLAVSLDVYSAAVDGACELPIITLNEPLLEGMYVRSYRITHLFVVPSVRHQLLVHKHVLQLLLL